MKYKLFICACISSFILTGAFCDASTSTTVVMMVEVLPSVSMEIENKQEKAGLVSLDTTDVNKHCGKTVRHSPAGTRLIYTKIAEEE